MRNYLTFGGADSRDYGVYISGSDVFNAPARDYNMQSIPGRDGALVGYEKRLENIEVTYPAFIYANYKERIQAWRNFLLSCVGYQRLTDSYHTDEFRLGVYAGPMDVEPTTALKAGRFDMSFDCKPQRFLVSGEIEQTFSASRTINNPTLFPSRPLIRIVGKGTVGIGGKTLTVLEHPYYTYGMFVDCNTLDAYWITGGTYVNLNRYLQLSSNDYPELAPGSTAVTLGTGITQVRITPRWWRL